LEALTRFIAGGEYKHVQFSNRLGVRIITPDYAGVCVASSQRLGVDHGSNQGKKM
jgi:hypothetical protein